MKNKNENKGTSISTGDDEKLSARNTSQFSPAGVSVPRETGEPEGGIKTIEMAHATEGGCGMPEAEGGCGGCGYGSASLQGFVALMSFICAIGFAIAGFVTPPQGEVHESTLYLIAQFLLVTTSILGVSSIVSYGRWSLRNGEPRSRDQTR